MTAGGYIMMIGSWVFIIALAWFCMRKVLTLRKADAENIKPIYEIDTGDVEKKEETDD